MTPVSLAALSRRHDLDWIRVGAFALLILYHVGMFYVPWEWHVKSPRLVPALEPAMMLTNPWRLTLLFLVSGAATRFLFDRFQAQGAGAARRFAASRTFRLLPPLLLAMIAIVPPQSYYEVYEALQAKGVADPAHAPWLHHFWLRYITGSGHWCDAGGCLLTPTWNHMWFVAYLLVYSLAAAGLLALVAPRLPALQAGLERALRGWRLLVWPIVWLAAIRLTLAPIFPLTHTLVGDWYNHALSFGAYLFGFLFARSEALKAGLVDLRRPALILALAAWAVLVMDVTLPGGRAAVRVVYAADQWAFIAAVLGYGARYLDRDGPALRYLTAGVFPAYLVHQSVIVVVAHNLAPARLPLPLEAAVVIVATLGGCVLAYELARRLGPLGIVLGVQNRRRPAAALPQPA